MSLPRQEVRGVRLSGATEFSLQQEDAIEQTTRDADVDRDDAITAANPCIRVVIRAAAVCARAHRDHAAGAPSSGRKTYAAAAPSRCMAYPRRSAGQNGEASHAERHPDAPYRRAEWPSASSRRQQARPKVFRIKAPVHAQCTIAPSRDGATLLEFRHVRQRKRLEAPLKSCAQ
jgi:hypothetical protein